MDANLGQRHALVAAMTARIPPPPLSLTLREWPRAAVTVARLAWRWRGLGVGQGGDGRPVMVLPGLFNSDRSNVALRGFLRRIGYDARGWGLGRNLGTRTIGAEADRLIARVEAFAAEAAQPVTLIGVSLGGIMARLVAHRRSDLVREVITISSPYAGHPHATRVWRAFELFTGERVDDPHVSELAAEIVRPLPVKATAIWSASDGLVAGAACRGGDCAAIEVSSGHLGVQLHPDVLVAVGGILARST
ncbi:alpha/beta hydrolase [uncultured Sphingomonas sp.]|uniref:esterase/lipase family protein n=1 Tax=uncultured Sphingomonas sp. TaxID=158754 RepID=UPI0025EBD2A1|nr:alpha/beta hydrolase [uncultured Sphingomonas sp.]